MFVYKYPHWAIWLQVGEKVHYFDGVKDMIKFYLAPNKYGYDYKPSDYTHVVVLDYFTQESIDATHAFYVVGSNVNGPMGLNISPLKINKMLTRFLLTIAAMGCFCFAIYEYRDKWCCYAAYRCAAIAVAGESVGAYCVLDPVWLYSLCRAQFTSATRE
ncbi:nitrous oxide reductase accessory protein NosL [Moritella yayanosii]|uniref:Uncharacterized protein n=1 Tax=Moritella yayanosii TaxID=69539 RepID=A0A330LIC7_9GAMM|nr:nitrous oxide reductase accessory protein NosL [Moritella yayanosii]SQD76684.1 protein of unknown function [Moritella yayanosii]